MAVASAAFYVRAEVPVNEAFRGAVYAGGAIVCVVLAALLHGLIVVFLIFAAVFLLVAAREAWRRAVR